MAAKRAWVSVVVKELVGSSIMMMEAPLIRALPDFHQLPVVSPQMGNQGGRRKVGWPSNSRTL